MSADRRFHVALALGSIAVSALAGKLVGGVTLGVVCGCAAILIVATLLFARGDRLHPAGEGTQAINPDNARRIGLYSGPGSWTNVRKARFGQELDTGTHNDGGEVDAEEADFGR
jgi:hypothetical protein